MDKKQADFGGVTNPMRVLRRREDEASSIPDKSKGVDAGDLPGPAVDFFKPRSAEQRKGPPADMLKKHYGK